MSWTLTNSGAATAKAGSDVSTSILGDSTALDKFSDEAEGRIVAECRRDWVDSYSDIDTHVKELLSDVCSSLIAIMMIQYDMSGYASMRLAETMLDINDDRAQRGLSILKDMKSNTIQGV